MKIGMIGAGNIAGFLIAPIGADRASWPDSSRSA